MPRNDTISKTLVLKVEVDDETDAILRARGKTQARWMNRVLRLLYSDKRNNGWKRYGPTADFTTDGHKQGALVVTDDNKSYKVRQRVLYNAFIGGAALPVEVKTSTPMKSTDKQATLDKIGTVWQNFLNGDVTETPRPTSERLKGRRRRLRPELSRPGRTLLPHFGPVAMFMHSDMDWSTDAKSIRLKLYGRVNKTVLIVHSDRSDFQKYIRPLLDTIDDGHGAEFHFDTQKKEWYVHVAVKLPRAVPPGKVDVAVGVDMGIRRDMAYAVVTDVTTMPAKTGSISTNIDRFVQNEKRMSELRKVTDKGRPWHVALMRQSGASEEEIARTIRYSKSARRAKKRLKGHHSNMNKTMIREDTAHIVGMAVKSGAQLIATEDMSRARYTRTYKRKGRKCQPTNEERAFNRRVTLWGRGWAKDALEHKCNEHGLCFRLVTTKGNSHTCPVCGHEDLQNRDFKKKTFKCTQCGYASGDDDVVAAINIGRKGWQKFHPVKSSRSNPSAGSPKGDGGLIKSGLVTAEGASPEQTDNRCPAATSVEKSENPTNGAVDPSEDPINGPKSPQGPHVDAHTSRRRKRSDRSSPDKHCDKTVASDNAKRETRGGVATKSRRTSRSDDKPVQRRRNRMLKGPKNRTLSQPAKGEYIKPS